MRENTLYRHGRAWVNAIRMQRIYNAARKTPTPSPKPAFHLREKIWKRLAEYPIIFHPRPDRIWSACAEFPHLCYFGAGGDHPTRWGRCRGSIATIDPPLSYACSFLSPDTCEVLGPAGSMVRRVGLWGDQSWPSLRGLGLGGPWPGNDGDTNIEADNLAFFACSCVRAGTWWSVGLCVWDIVLLGV